MDRGEDDIELLVHITAPATTAADEHYRQLARAYADFVPSQATGLRDPEDEAIASSIDFVDDSFEEASKQGGPMRTELARCEPPADGASRQRDDAVSGSRDAVDLGSGYTRHEGTGKSAEDSTCCIVVPDSQAEERNASLIDEVPDSYPVGSVRLDPFVSPTRMLEHHLRRIKAAARPPKRALEYEQDPSQPAEVAATPQKVAKTLSQQTPRAPSFSLQSGTPEFSAMETVDIIASSVPPVIYGSPAEDEALIEATSDSLPPANSTQSEDSGASHCGVTNSVKTTTILFDAPLRRHQSDHGARTTTDPAPPSLARSTSEPSPRVPPEVLESYKKKFGALEVFPPEPAVSVDHLDESSLLTPRLEKLVKVTALEQVYRPRFHPSKGVSETKSDLRPLQRGYWLLDMSTWDEPSRWTTWARLHDCVGGGAAGWRVWCMRDEPCVRIRTYCWAALAAHVYLLLNEVSGGRVRCVDIAWIGDEGRPRISVPAAMGRSGGR